MTPQLRRTDLARLARLEDPVGVFFLNAIQNSQAANGRCRRVTYLVFFFFEKATSTMTHGSPWLASALAVWLSGWLAIQMATKHESSFQKKLFGSAGSVVNRQAGYLAGWLANPVGVFYPGITTLQGPSRLSTAFFESPTFLGVP